MLLITLLIVLSLTCNHELMQKDIEKHERVKYCTRFSLETQEWIKRIAQLEVLNIQIQENTRFPFLLKTPYVKEKKNLWAPAPQVIYLLCN